MREATRAWLAPLLVVAVAAGAAPTGFADETDVYVEEDRLLADDGSGDDRFGSAVSIDGYTALVGAPRQDNARGVDAGAAYVLQRGPNGAWTQQAKLVAADGRPGDRFGGVVALDDDRALVGVPRDDNVNGVDAGSAYVFDRGPNGTWTQSAKLLARDGEPQDAFGESVALGDDRALVAAASDSHSGVDNAGSGYVFAEDDGNWSQEAKLVARTVLENDFLGFSAALDGDRAVLGAPLGGVARAVVFERDAGAWSQEASLSPADTAGGFGWDVALDGSQALVGARFDDNANGENAGSGYVFTHQVPYGWRQQAKLVPDDGSAQDGAGSSLALDDGTAVLGERDRDLEASSAYVFEANATGWTEQPRPVASNGADRTWTVALDDGRLLVGEPREDNTKGLDAGGGHVFRLVG